MEGASCARAYPGMLAAEESNAEAEDLITHAINVAACTSEKATPQAVGSDGTTTATDTTTTTNERRLRVPQLHLDDDDEDYVAGQCPFEDVETLNGTVTDTTPTTLPAVQKRAKDEVDVAAKGIPLEVRRLQCTKSTLALQEATKNDATPQSAKLVDYLVSLTKSTNGLCTEQEMCGWLVAQMCDRIAMGQVWVVAKTYKLLSALLWRGSGSFVAAVHDYGAAMFQAAHLVTLLKKTKQENLTGDRLPCQLQPIESASAGQKSAAGKAKPHGPCVFEMMKRRVCSAAASKGSVSDCIPAGDMSLLIASVAYLESLCEYRMRHPTLDLAHGEILMVDPSDSAALADPVAAEVGRKTASLTVWKELLDDTLELMKAIAVTDPHVPACPLGSAGATARLREAVLLYQVACRALVRLLHAMLTTSHTFVASIQAGLQVPSSNLPLLGGPAKAPPSTRTSNLLGVAFDLNALDYSLSPDVLHGYSNEYYNAIYQFNRTVKMLRDYIGAAHHLEKNTAARALRALRMIPESSLLEMKSTMTSSDIAFCQNNMDRLFVEARHAAEQVVAGKSKGDAQTALSTTVAPQSPLSLEEVLPLMMAVHKYHTEKGKDMKMMWRHQVDAVCALFDDEEAAMLHQVFDAGLEGVARQWQEFTNNGAAAAEKALMMSSSFLSKRTGSNMPGLSSSDNGASGDRSSGRQDSGRDALTRSSTYILRSLPSDVQARGTPTTKTDLISLNRSSDSYTENAIDTLLQEDDVVVICNEECSCNDTMKLVDRFQVLMDVPLGEGSYARVYRAWDEAIGCYLAVKELPLDASKAHNVAVREVLQEYTVLTELSHPNIVRVVAFMVLKRTARIYMEWVPSGSLQDVLRHHPRGMLRESVVRRYARDVLSGLAFLHSRGVIHRDVKPGNMLLSSDGAVKLTDFGTSLVLSGNTHTLESDVVAGTAAYMAPESMKGVQSSASDIWSFGCAVVQLIGGQVPWYNAVTKTSPEPLALLFKIGCLDDTTHLERPHDALKAAAKAARENENTPASRSALPSPSMGLADAAKEPVCAVGGGDETASPELLAMLDAIFVADRRKRPSASELLQHPFCKLQ